MSTMLSCCERLEVTVHTSPGLTCGTFSRLWLNLIGSEGETLPIAVNEGDRHLLPGSSCPVYIQSKAPLGRLLLVRLRLEPRSGYPEQDWHCRQVEVRRSTGGQIGGGSGAWSEDPDVHVFLCDKWLQTSDGDVDLRSGKLCLLKDETEEKLKQHRLTQLQRQQKIIRWRTFVDGAPQCVDMNSSSELGPNLSYTHKSQSASLSCLRGFADRSEPWKSFSELETVFIHSGQQNHIAKFVQAHWKEDWYFGHQCLNGCNPLMLRQTKLLPPNLSVTNQMLRPFLPEGSSLDLELQKGNIYLLDFEVLEGIPANVINGRQSFLSAPLCLLHLDRQGQLRPIAIQLQQTPGPGTPVFLPSDPGCDWLLAKVWVHSADFQTHQLFSHYLRTHMMGELCCVATLRALPEMHPLYQLLMPHVRTSMQINIQARNSLLAADGVFDKATAAGLQSLPVALSRATDRLHYESLCVCDDLMQRGIHTLPNSYYAKDALRVWGALHRFVFSWVDLYYHGDNDVQQDSELQNWLTEINTHGFPPESGFPQSFQTKAEVSKFLTMIIFSCSALHAALNFSQLDFGLWMPNHPAAMLRPPPQVKGGVTEEDIVSFLPDINSTCRVLMALNMLSQPAVDYVPLCHYREVVFGVDAHRRLLDAVQAELRAISDDITQRNSQLELPYPYMCPSRIENSVAI